MYGIENYVQIVILVKAVGVGFLIGAIYNISMLLRITAGKNRWLIFTEDIIFFVICAAVTFLFAFEVNFGYIRFYMLAGEGIGFCIYYLLPGKSVAKLFGKIIGPAKRRFSSLCGHISARTRAYKNQLSEKKSKINKKPEKNKKKSSFFSRKLLHKKNLLFII